MYDLKSIFEIGPLHYVECFLSYVTDDMNMAYYWMMIICDTLHCHVSVCVKQQSHTRLASLIDDVTQSGIMYFVTKKRNGWSNENGNEIKNIAISPDPHCLQSTYVRKEYILLLEPYFKC